MREEVELVHPKNKANLFKTTQLAQKIDVKKAVLNFDTPIGKLGFFTKINNLRLDEFNSSRYQLSPTVELVTWNELSFQVEVLRIKIQPNLPEGMFVDECIAVIWRIKSHINNLSVGFEARWQTLIDPIPGYPHTGEGLEAQEWETKDFTLAIGTEDADYLGQRAHCEEYLPKRLSAYFLELDGDEHPYLNDGMCVNFPPIHSGECIQAHYVVAFTRRENDISPWYAVDMRARDLLDFAECS